MASTRNKNTCGDYYLEQKQSQRILDDRIYKYRRIAYNDALPCAGINVGSIPNSQLANNATDIESSLYGINSTNLVQPKAPVVPQLKNLRDIAFFERPQVFIPEPLVVENNQRPPKP
jgi:hypothetical protein